MIQRLFSHFQTAKQPVISRRTADAPTSLLRVFFTKRFGMMYNKLGLKEFFSRGNTRLRVSISRYRKLGKVRVNEGKAKIKPSSLKQKSTGRQADAEWAIPHRGGCTHRYSPRKPDNVRSLRGG